MMNKKRLAAFALSAVMATSTMSFPVNAAEFSDGADVAAQSVDVTEDTTDAAGDTSQGYVLDSDSVVFHYNEAGVADFTVTFNRVNPEGKTQAGTATATTAKRLAANCFHPGLLWMTVTIDGQTFTSGNTDNNDEAFVIPGEPQREHKWAEIKRQTITYPTHDNTGLAHVWYECEYDDCDATYDDDVVLEAQEHTYGDWVYEAGENVKADSKGYVIFDENGDPELIDELKDGLYYKVQYCTKGDGAENGRQEIRVYAKKAAYAMIIDQDGIATQLVDNTKYESPTVTFPLDEATIELEDCSKEGWYVVEYYTVENKPISQEKIKVAPHHYNTFNTAEFATKDDMDQCTVEYNTDGSVKVTNKSCYLPVDYTEVTHCSAAGCPEKAHDAKFEAPYDCGGAKVIKTEAKTAEPAGDHIIKTSAKKAVTDLVKRGKVLYSELKAIADVKENFVQISARPENNCEEAGTVAVKFICVVDKTTVVEEMNVDVIASGHTRDIPTRDNYVAPTCTSMGSYDAVVVCKTCGKELERRENVKIPRIKHTNEISVDVNGVGKDDKDTDTTAYIKFVGDKVVDVNGESLALKGKVVDQNWMGTYKADVSGEFKMVAGVYTNCTVCNNHEIELNSSDEITLKVVDVVKQKESGEAGSITLLASYTNADKKVVTEEITVPYFTSIEAYQGRVEDAPLNGLHLDKDGVYRYYIDDVFQKDFTGIVEYAGERFFVTNGVLASEANGLNLYDGTWYFLSEGQIQRHHNGLAEYDGQWFYIVNGRLDTTVNGLVPYDGGMFVFAEGRLVKEANGLWQDSDGTWYFLALGQVQTQHTGVAMYDGAFFYIENGKLASDYEGTVEYDGATFKVVAGQLYGPIK